MRIMDKYFKNPTKIEKFFTKILGLWKNILLPFRGNYYIVYFDKINGLIEVK